jgi:hypothetical protein
MFSKLSLSLAAALALSAAGGVARAAPIPTSTDEARALAHSPTNAEINAAETGNPHSVDYRNRAISSHSPTNDEINAAETGSPELGYLNDQQRLPPDDNWQAEWQALELGSPDKA